MAEIWGAGTKQAELYLVGKGEQQVSKVGHFSQ